MTTSEIRNKLIENKTLYNQSKLMLRQAKDDTNALFASISEDDKKLLTDKGFDVTVFSMDVDAIQTQEEADRFVERLRVLTGQLHQYLEQSLIGR